ncbi:MAG: FGGY family carbohydrate kinase, partial [Terriglobales bacterium]
MDTGTGGSRAVLVDERGAVRAAASAAHAPMALPHPRWAEQDPEDWWRAARRAIHRVLREGQVSGEAVAGIGLTGQMHGVVL